MTTSPPRPPAGRYGRETSPASRRRLTVAVALAGVAGVALALWVGVGAARTPVRWTDVGFTLRGADAVEVEYEVIRRDPSQPVVCTLEALNESYGQVGVVEVDVPPSEDGAVRLRSVVRTSEQAVTGLVKYCSS